MKHNKTLHSKYGPIASLLIGLAALVHAAPFSMTTEVKDSKGNIHSILMEGDEFSVSYETQNGYTLLERDGRYFYALRDGKNGLKCSEIELGCENDAIPGSLERHMRDTSEEYGEEIDKRVNADESTVEILKNWEDSKNAKEPTEETEEEISWIEMLWNWICGLFSSESNANESPYSSRGGIKFGAPPKTHTVGDILGLTIMVDFPRKGSSKTEAEYKHPNITRDTVDWSVNGFTGDSINPSVREFYFTNSCGRLNLTNAVLDYVLLDKPRSYYDDTTKSCGTCGKLLVNDVFAKLQKRSDYKTFIYPLLSKLSHDENGRIRSLSILFAGGSSTKWSYGLWAHKGMISGLPTVVSTDGTKMRFYNYQISSLWEFGKHGEIYVRTFIHESGHMVCAFPDLYDYRKKSKGAGYYSYMANGHIADPYLAYKAGWIDPIEITAKSMELRLPADYRTVYKYTNPQDAKEYFLLKYYDGTGIDSEAPGTGILICRCNESGNNVSSSFIGPKKSENYYRRSYEFSIVQSDGRYDLERNVQSGEQRDFWNSPTQRVNDVTVPNLQWRKNTDSDIQISDFEVENAKERGYASCRFEIDMPQITVQASGFEGKYNGKAHRITVKKISPTSGVTIKYCKTAEGKYTSTNPGYTQVGEYVTYFQASKKGYFSTNGFERVIIQKK